MAKLTLAFVSAALVEEDGKLSIELVEDAPLARTLPLVGSVLPARETVQIASLTGAVDAIHGAFDGVRKLLGK